MNRTILVRDKERLRVVIEGSLYAGTFLSGIRNGVGRRVVIEGRLYEQEHSY